MDWNDLFNLVHQEIGRGVLCSDFRLDFDDEQALTRFAGIGLRKLAVFS